MNSFLAEPIILSETDNEETISIEKDIREEIVEKDIRAEKVKECFRKNGSLKCRTTITETISERITKRNIHNGSIISKENDDDEVEDDDEEVEEEKVEIITAPRCFVSKGERVISDYLKKNNITFIPQKRYKNCRYKHPLPFDFYLPDNNILIEYDGKQHFIPDGRMVTVEDFQKHVQKDTIKLKYAIGNGITLLRISYLETDDIAQILDEVLNDENMDSYRFLYDILNICNIKVLTHYCKQMENATKKN
jgi:very-short-patch-repair endonuclease